MSACRLAGRVGAPSRAKAMPGACTEKCLGPIFQTVYFDRRIDFFFFDFSSRVKVDVVSLSLLWPTGAGWDAQGKGGGTSQERHGTPSPRQELNDAKVDARSTVFSSSSSPSRRSCLLLLLRPKRRGPPSGPPSEKRTTMLPTLS